MRQSIGILIFDGAEILDFCGPYEVFSTAGRVGGDAYHVFTVAEKTQIRSNNGLVVVADYDLENAPRIDVLLVPGGMGTRQAITREPLIDWVRERANAADRVLSVCTGVFLLVKAGLVDGLSLTTHHAAMDELRQLAPENPIDEEARFLDHGRIAISAGISAGIDLSFHVVSQRLGEEKAVAVAHYMEYAWQPNAS